MVVDAVRRGREADGLHHHRQFRRREGSVPPSPARSEVPVRRTRRARPARLAGIGLPRGRRLRRARHLRPLRRRQRVLFGSARGARVPARRRTGARVLQRLLPGTLFPAEGGPSLRLQHPESAAAEQRIGRDRSQSRARRALAQGSRAPTAIVERRRTARAAATACVRSSRTCR